MTEKNQLNVLLVEDDQGIHQIITHFIQTMGQVNLLTAVDFDTAIAQMQRYMPDLVIIDYMLPGGKNGM